MYGRCSKACFGGYVLTRLGVLAASKCAEGRERHAAGTSRTMQSCMKRAEASCIGYTNILHIQYCFPVD